MKLKNIMIFFISTFCIMFYNNNVQAVTEAQKRVGQSIADFAGNLAIEYEKDFQYSCFWGLDSEGNPKKMDNVMSYRNKANEARNTILWLRLC